MGPATASRVTQPVRIPVARRLLAGDLAVPPGAIGLVVFAHGSGSSRFSPRNRHVADVLDRHALATLLIDLLTQEEEAVDQRTGQLRFDIDLLAARLRAVAAWAAAQPPLARLRVGFFGASTGAGAALLAAAEESDRVHAIVARGGRPDLAGADPLARVTAPTLLIVGSLDDVVRALNQRAMAFMRAPARLEIVPGATHLFEEPGTLDVVADLASEWFARHLNV